jgi:arylsulfatase A-like enzyme
VRVHEPVPDAPSVLLITSDTHRADHIGAAGKVDILTPNLDALAQRGVMFEDCFTATNVTNPSHIALMTAVHPRDTMILNNYRPLVEDANTLAEQFRAAGYATIAITSANHLGHEGSGLGQGFDRMYRPRSPQIAAKHSIDVLEYYLREYEDTPVFVWLHVFDAHTPYAPPAPYDRLYYPEGSDPYDPDQADPDVPAEINAQFFAGLKDMDFPAAQYRGEITYLDDQLRRVFDIPRFAEGVIAFTADHGECIGHHGIFYDHAGLYPSSVHVPLILAYPNCPEGVRVERPVQHINIGRTLLELAGLSASEFPGENLLDLLEEGASQTDSPRFAISAHGFSASLSHGRWHLILHLREHEDNAGIGGPYLQGATELYDRDNDPFCTSDVLEDQFEVAKELRSQLVEWLGNADPRGLAGAQTSNTQTIRQLAALGYTMQSASSSVHALWDVDCDTEWCRRFR